MQSQSFHSAIGAAALNQNLLAGTALEYIGNEARTLTLYLNGDITGMIASLSFNRGGDSDLPLPASVIGVASTPGKIKVNEDFVGQYPVPAGSRLVLSVQNPGGASNVNALLVMQ